MRKRVIILAMAAAVLTLTTSCVVSGYKNGSREVSKKLKVKSFERIDLSGNFDVVYEQGDSVAVSVEGQERQLAMIDVRSDGTTLWIKPRPISLNGFRRSVRVYVSSPDLTGVNLTGNGDFETKGHVDTDHLTVRLTGNGDITFSDLICDRVDVQLTGNGDVEIHGLTAGYVNLQLIGNGDIEVKGRTRKVDVQKAGNGDIDVEKLTILR